MNTLFARLSVIFFFILLALGLVTLWLSHRSSQNYFLEFTQKLNRPIAMYIAENAQLVKNGTPNPQALEQLAPHVMMINPSIEVYLLDPSGKIISTVETAAKHRTHVAMAPIQEFLEGDVKLPLFGDDPRYAERNSVFSVFPLYSDNNIASSGTGVPAQRSAVGYVYAVLASEKHQTLLASVKNSYSISDLFVTLAGVLTFALLAGLLLFFKLTKRLRVLTADAREMQRNLGVSGKGTEYQRHGGDEIGLLNTTYEALTQQLLEQNEKLKAGDASRRQFVASLSHDLRTPLMTLQNYLETLLEKNNSLSSFSKIEFLKLASKQSYRLGELINQLFELSKLNSPDIRLHPENFSILELLYDCLQDFSLLCQNSNISVEITQSDKPDHSEQDFTVKADIAAIQRVVENLLGNAVKYTNDGGRVAVWVTRDSSDTLQVSVENSTDEPYEDQLHRIFSEQAEEMDITSGFGQHKKGSGGLGLIIVKRIIELHGCKIWVECDPCFGTRFNFTLPSRTEPLPSTEPLDLMLSA